jgi:sulfate adenylyltransferase
MRLKGDSSVFTGSGVPTRMGDAASTVDTLIPAHGGSLMDLVVDQKRAQELRALSNRWLSWDLTARQSCDLELMMNGGFSPLRGFMRRGDYESVCESMRLTDGTLWPIPIVLDVPEAFGRTIEPGGSVALRDPEGVMLAVLHVDDVWMADLMQEAQNVYGTTERHHPGVAALLDRTHPCFVGGLIEGVVAPLHHDFTSLRKPPMALRARFRELGWNRIVAFQTRNPMHRAHQELTLRAARDAAANLLIHPVVGMTKPGDVDHYTRVRCYESLMRSYPAGTAMLSLLPLAMRMGGPREALWHAIIRKNFGCTHFIVGRDHAAPGAGSDGKPYYGPYAAQDLLREHEEELGVTMMPFPTMVYVKDLDSYLPEDQVPEGLKTMTLSGTQLREMLATGQEIPAWFTPAGVASELRSTHPPRLRQGVTIFFTGLSGSGKSTIANALLVKLLEDGSRPVTLLDGDIVRKHLSSELGFSKEHRDLNIRRIGYVASEITKNGGIAICAPIAPYREARRDVRDMIEPLGGFVLVHIATSLEVCERRDRKGLYAKARAGLLPRFTGISDPYEEPRDAELAIDTTTFNPQESADQILAWLRREGYLARTLERRDLT